MPRKGAAQYSVASVEFTNMTNGTACHMVEIPQLRECESCVTSVTFTNASTDEFRKSLQSLQNMKED